MHYRSGHTDGSVLCKGCYENTSAGIKADDNSTDEQYI